MFNSNKFSIPVIGLLVFITTFIADGINAQAVAPTVSTTAVLEFASTAAIMGGNATSDGGAAIFARGVVYSSTDTTPEIEEAGVTAEPNESGTGVFSELIGPLLPGTTYYVQAYAANSEGTSHGGVQSFTTKQGPEINLVGNGNSISDGDDSPSATDHTDFGNMSVDAGTVVRTFTIQNTGDMTLTLDSTSPYVSISGTHTGDFSVTATPNNSINAGGSTTFNITFNPSGAGTRSAAISIDNNDINEDPYNFDIQGTGINISAPSTQANSIVFSNVHAAKLSLSWTSGNGDAAAVFVMEGSSGSATPVNDISYTADPIFGAGDQIGSTGWYCVYNGTGTSTNVYGIRPGSTYRLMVCEYNDDSGFIRYNSNTAASNPLNQALPYLFINEIDSDTPGADVAEFVELYDGGAGNTELDYLTVVFFNGSSDESYRKFDLDGESTDVNGYLVIGNAGVSGVDITFANSGLQNGADAVALYVADGTDFPSGTAVTTTGLIDAIVYDTDDADDAGLLVLLNGGQPQVNENFVSNSENYSLQRIPNGTGGYRNTNSYTVDFPTPDNSNGNPDMQVLGNAHEIADGDATPSFVDETDFGSADIVTGSVVRTYTIKNIGEKSLTLTGGIKVVLGGTDAADFSVSQQPNSPVASGGGTTTFQVTFNPSTTGLKSATISIDNDDPDENPYNYSIQGTATSTPEMKVEGNTNEIVDGDDSPSYSDHTIFSSVVVNGGTSFRTFTIKNTGSANLNLSGVSVGGTNAADFTITLSATSPVASGGGSTTFQITFNPSAGGIRTASISIDNDDPDENPYNYSIQGTATSTPEMKVEGNTNEIVDGDDSPSYSDHTIFGSVVVNGGTIFRTFTIKNIGAAPLNLTGSPRVVINGADAAEFSVTSQPNSPISGGGGDLLQKNYTINNGGIEGNFTAFQITFNPSSTGIKNATVSIDNDDPDENPYDFAIQGTGTGIPEISVEGNSIIIVDGDVTPSTADHTDFGTPSEAGGSVTRIFTIKNSGSAELTLAGTPKVSVSGTHATDFTVTVFPTSPVAALNGSTTFKITFTPSASGVRSAALSIPNDDGDENPYNFSIRGTAQFPPTGGNDNVTLNEDSSYTFTVADFTFNDADGDTFDGIKLLSLETAGDLEYNGADVTAPSDYADVTKLVFTPEENESGSPYAEFTFKVKDSHGDYSESSYTMSIEVTSINDAPSFTASDPSAVNEDTGLQTITNWASFDAGPDDEDASQNVLGYSISNINNPGLFAVMPSLETNGTLSYTPATNAFGVTTFDVTVQDDGGTTNGGVDISDTKSFTITIININDQPGFTAADPPATLEDTGSQTIVDWASFDAGPDNEDATQSVLAYALTNISNPGLFSAIPSIGIDGTLTYTPSANAFGISTFDVVVQDDGGTTDGGVDISDTQSFTITITSVNDQPIFTAIDPPAILEDAGLQTIVDWASFDAGPDDEDATQSVLGYTITNIITPGLFSAIPSVGTDGTLTYTPAQNVFGTTTFDVTVQDDGGTTNGGIDLSVVQTFTISVIGINDPPTTTGISDVFVDEDAPNTVIDLTQSFNDAEDGSSGLSYTVENVTNNNLFNNVNINNGELTLAYASNQFGTSDITIRAEDSGSLTVESIFTINVISINDPPVFTNGGLPDIEFNEDENASINLNDYLADPDNDQSSLVCHARVIGLNGSSTVIPINFFNNNNPDDLLADTSDLIINIDSLTHEVLITATEDSTGTFIVEFSVSDQIDAAVYDTITVTVNQVNDAPVITFQLSPITINEDDVLIFPFRELYPFVNDPDDADSTLIFGFVYGGNNFVLDEVTDTTVKITPKENWFGLDTVSVFVSDGFLSDRATLGINVLSVNDLPYFINIPDTVESPTINNAVIDLWNCVKDVENLSSELKYEFTVSNDSLSLNYDDTKGKLTLSTTQSYEGEVTVRIFVTDLDGGKADTSFIYKSNIITGIEALSGIIPKEYILEQNYPNPFNPSTTIRFGLPFQSYVKLTVYDILGQKKELLTNKMMTAGYHEVIWNAANLASGIYLYTIYAEALDNSRNFTTVKKMILIK